MLHTYCAHFQYWMFSYKNYAEIFNTSGPSLKSKSSSPKIDDIFLDGDFFSLPSETTKSTLPTKPTPTSSKQHPKSPRKTRHTHHDPSPNPNPSPIPEPETETSPPSTTSTINNSNNSNSNNKSAAPTPNKATPGKRPKHLSALSIRQIDLQKIHRSRVKQAKNVEDAWISEGMVEKWARMRNRHSQKLAHSDYDDIPLSLKLHNNVINLNGLIRKAKRHEER